MKPDSNANGLFSMSVMRIFALLCLLYGTAYAQPNLSLGPFGPGIIDGTAPFNTDGNCTGNNALASAGDDCGSQNNQVRTQDDVVFNWSVAASNFTPGQENLQNVVLEQVLTPSANADVNFPRIPARCTPAGGGGINPPSAITTETNGDIKLTCNLGEFANGVQSSFSTSVKASGNSQNGSTFTSRQRIYSLADDGTPNATEANYPASTYNISARPMVDISLSPARWLTAITERNFGQGPEKFYYSYVNVRIATPQRAGTEAVQQPLTFDLQLTATQGAVNGADYTQSGFEFYIEQCIKNPTLWSGEVYGDEDYNSSQPIERKVIDSGNCSYSRSNASDTASAYNFTISNANLSGTRFPTQAGGNVDLSAGPYYYANMRLRYLIPVRVIDAADGNSDGSGSIYVSGVLQNFDPVSVSGIPNYGGAVKEPGYNGNPMPDGTKSNNLNGPYNYTVTTRGTWSHSARPRANNAGTSFGTFAGSWHSGGGTLPPNKAYVSYTPLGNNGSNELSNPSVCNVFDNSTQKLTDRGNVGATSGTYAYVGTHAAGGFDHTNYIVEYGHIDLSGDDPLDNNGDGTPDYNNQTGRYEGKWEIQGLARCDDNATDWQTDPNQVSGGIDEVNIVRVRLKDSVKDTVKLGSTQYIRFVTPLEVRNQFHGGPHAGENIPVGTVLASFGSVRVDEYWAGNWTPANRRPYQPAPENSRADGDRVTLARTESYLNSESLTPPAAPGNTNSTVAGNQIIWKVSTSIQSLVSDTAQEENVQIIAELPPEVSYNKSCTTSYTDSNGHSGTPASLVQYNTDRNGNPKTDYTRLIWNLGTVTANTTIPPRVICTDSDALAPNFSSVTGYFEIRGDTLVSLLSQRSDTHTITLEQIGNIQVSKEVDLTLDNKNEPQQHVLRWANFASSFTIEPPVVIDVLPYNADGGASGSERVPPSSFGGTFGLAAAPVTTWLDGSAPAAGEQPIGTWYYTNDPPNTIDSNPDDNTSNWCLEADFNSGNPGCPASFSGSNAIKFVSNYPLAQDGDPRQGMETTLQINASGNAPGDNYTNRFTFDSGALPPEQFLLSNPVTVYVASYSIGDLIFADVNGNKQYDLNVDKPVPDEVTVNLHRSDGTLLKSTKTGLELPGRYLFNRLDSGDYYIEIPAGEFQMGGLLEEWGHTLTIDDIGLDDDLNEAEDQDGYKPGAPATTGIRSNIITLSAIPPLPGQVPRGKEPTADNTAGISDSTSDDFSNYTLDIGLEPAYDLGDAPLSYGTAPHLHSNAAAPHLGWARPDAEKTTMHSSAADGDGEDENSLPLPHIIDWQVGIGCRGLLPDGTMGTRKITPDSYCMMVRAHNPLDNAAQVIAWLDFNNNGDFYDTNEQSIVILDTDSSNDATQGNLPANSINRPILLYWENVSAPNTPAYLRIRVTDDPAFKDPTLLSPTLPARNGEVEDYYLTLTPALTYIEGNVYNDADVDRTNDPAESGLEGVVVVLHDTANNSCNSTYTTADGSYRFLEVLPGNYQLYTVAQETVPTPQRCDPAQAANPSGYLTTTGNTSVAFNATTAPVSGIAFGYIKPPLFEQENQQTVLPNATTLHPHRFTAQSNGSVRFSIASQNSSPVNDNWSAQLYRDENCDGQLDNGAVALTNNITVSAGQQICLLNKVFAPATVSTDAYYTIQVQSEFTFGNGNILPNDVQTRQDITLSLAGTSTAPPDPSNANPTGAPDLISGEGQLTLQKSVWNVTRNIDGSVALPGETLRYTIHYENIGNGSLNELIIADNVPEYTALLPASLLCTDHPAELPLCTTNEDNTGNLSWSWTTADILLPGSKGSVSYEVVVQ